MKNHPCPVLMGDRLLSGIFIMEQGNACFVEDPELGILEKEETHAVSF